MSLSGTERPRPGMSAFRSRLGKAEVFVLNLSFSGFNPFRTFPKSDLATSCMAGLSGYDAYVLGLRKTMRRREFITLLAGTALWHARPGQVHTNPDGLMALGVCTPVHAMRRITPSRCSTNCDASASSMAKISWPMRLVTACLLNSMQCMQLIW